MTGAIYRNADLVFDVLETVERTERERLLGIVNEEAWRLAIRWADHQDLADDLAASGDTLVARAAWHEAVAAARICDLLAGRGSSAQTRPGTAAPAAKLTISQDFVSANSAQIVPAAVPLLAPLRAAREMTAPGSNQSTRVRAAMVKMMSANRKLSPVDLVDIGGERRRPVPRGPYCCSTYVSIEATCSDDCPFKASGCYVQAGFTGRAVRNLDARAVGREPLEVTLDEVDAIDWTFRGGVPQDGARGGRDLRLHDSGDASTAEAAKALGGAATRWRARGGGSVWTYTHSWREIPRSSWGRAISVLASVESPDDIRRARAAGYAPAIVVPEHKSPRAYEVRGTRIIPCPAETGSTTCVECRLCLDRDLFGMRAGIAFAAHGPGRGDARPLRVLAVLEAAQHRASNPARADAPRREA